LGPTVRRGALLFALLALSPHPAVAQVSEYDVKAAYLFNFVQFVTWPPSAFASPASPVRICLVGRNPFGEVLQSLTRNESFAGHGVEIVLLRDATDAQICHVVFFPAGTRASDVVRDIAASPVLTVGEGEGFLDAGGVIRFVIVDGRVRFDVSTRHAARAGLALSSRLLQVARQVQR
jgi:hypothetical protein